MFMFLFFAGFLRHNFKNTLHVEGNAQLVILHSEVLRQTEACAEFHRTNPMISMPRDEECTVWLKEFFVKQKRGG
jgi:hypothetical protein